MGLSLDQGRGSTWTRNWTQPGPVTSLNLDEEQGSAWTRYEAKLGSGTKLNLEKERGSTALNLGHWQKWGSTCTKHSAQDSSLN